MLRFSAEAAAANVVKGISSYYVPHYHNSRTSPLTVSKKLAKRCRDITYTQVCRGFKDLTSVKRALAKAAAVKQVKTILAVTGDKASAADISVFDLIRIIDKKRFRAAAALVFTRKNEAERAAKKAAAGATIFCTQPVFPSNSHRLVKVLRQLSLQHSTKCSISIGVFAPFQAAACKKAAKEKPDFITDTSFIHELAAEEKKGPLAAYSATVRLAKNNLASALKVAALVNKSRKSRCKVTGIHFFGLGDRVFGKGNERVRVSAGQLLRSITST
ncbi:hypothetical protein HYU16_01985 [Candidatus Woesearchaeota archaeon]|nr:hypothetical protein [Candidatus Woesearchaeota archaeon]